MAKKQTDRLRIEKVRGQGPKEIFGENAQIHDKSVNSFSKAVFETLKKDYPHLEFRFRDSIDKKEINEKLNSVDARLGVTIFVEKASIKPDGGIIEVKDASEEEKNLKEVNIGYYCFNTKWLMENVGKLENSNFQKEFYITDLVKIAVEAGEKVSSFSVDGVAGMGVNTKEQLEKADTFAKNL